MRRITGKTYRSDDAVAVFLNVGDPLERSADYLAAANILQLAVDIAVADGHASDEELNHILTHLEQSFHLPEQQIKRLTTLRYLLTNADRGCLALPKLKLNTLPHSPRQAVSHLLLAIATLDHQITADEIVALKKAFRSLDLDTEELDRLVPDQHPVMVQQGRPSAVGEAIPASLPQELGLVLDMEAVERIMAETREVAEILRDVLDTDEAIGEVCTPISSPEAPTQLSEVREPPLNEEKKSELSTLQALPVRFQPVLTELLDKERWTKRIRPASPPIWYDAWRGRGCDQRMDARSFW